VGLGSQGYGIILGGSQAGSGTHSQQCKVYSIFMGAWAVQHLQLGILEQYIPIGRVEYVRSKLF
jgi:hypothetical protein